MKLFEVCTAGTHEELSILSRHPKVTYSVLEISFPPKRNWIAASLFDERIHSSSSIDWNWISELMDLLKAVEKCAGVFSPSVVSKIPFTANDWMVLPILITKTVILIMSILLEVAIDGMSVKSRTT